GARAGAAPAARPLRVGSEMRRARSSKPPPTARRLATTGPAMLRAVSTTGRTTLRRRGLRKGCVNQDWSDLAPGSASGFEAPAPVADAAAHVVDHLLQALPLAGLPIEQRRLARRRAIHQVGHLHAQQPDQPPAGPILDGRVGLEDVGFVQLARRPVDRRIVVEAVGEGEAPGDRYEG